MVGVDNRGGTDTKVGDPENPQPPPDRPGSAGQPSRAESLAAAGAGESQGGGERDGKLEGEKVEPAEPKEPEDGEDAGGSEAESGEAGTEKSDVQGATGSLESQEGGHGRDGDGEIPRGPRAESLVRAQESQREGTSTTEDPASRTDETGSRETTGAGEAGDTREPVAGSSAGETSDAQTGVGERGERGAEQTQEPPAPLEVGRGPRAESLVRAIENQKAAAAEASATQQADTTGAQGRADDPGAPGGPPDEPVATGTKTPEDGELLAAQATDHEPDTGKGAADGPEKKDAQPGGWDARGHEPGVQAEGGTDGAEPLFAKPEPVAGDGGEPGPGAGETEAEAGEAVDPGGDGQLEPEPLGEPGGGPAERVDGGGEGGAPGGEDASDTGREQDGTERPSGERDAPPPVPEGEETPGENSDGTVDGNDDPGKNEDQVESQPPEDDEPVIYRITHPDGEPFGERDTDRWEFNRGELRPVDENQDLREPDPERDSPEKKLFRALNDNLEEALKNASKFSDHAQSAFKDKPTPSDHLTGTKFNKDQFHPTSNTVDYPNVVTGAVAVVMLGVGIWRGARKGVGAVIGRNNDRN